MERDTTAREHQKEDKRNIKRGDILTRIYVIFFHWEDSSTVEFATTDRDSAYNYMFNESIERGLYIPEDLECIIFEEKKLKRITDENLDECMKNWCDEGELRAEFKERLFDELDSHFEKIEEEKEK